MTLSINEDFTIITLASTKVDSFIASPASYDNIEITLTTNCTTSVTKTYTSASPITGTGDIRTSAGVETIYPSILSLSTFENGIIGVSVKLTTLGGSASTDRGCLFVDVDVMCDVPTDCLEKQMLYYTLVNSIACNCDCVSLCAIYDEIISDSTDNVCNCGA